MDDSTLVDEAQNRQQLHQDLANLLLAEGTFVPQFVPQGLSVYIFLNQIEEGIFLEKGKEGGNLRVFSQFGKLHGFVPEQLHHLVKGGAIEIATDQLVGEQLFDDAASIEAIAIERQIRPPETPLTECLKGTVAPPKQ